MNKKTHEIMQRRTDRALGMYDLLVITVNEGKTQKLSLIDFNNEVLKNVKILLDSVRLISSKKTFKLYKLKELIIHLSQLKVVISDIEQKANETKLLSINTLINSSRCGLKGETMAMVVSEVSRVCAQSMKYLKELNVGIDSTTQTITGVMSVINSTVDNDCNLFNIIKGQADYYAGKLVSSEELLFEMIDNSMPVSEIYKFTEKFNRQFNMDVQKLNDVLLLSLKHIKKLSERQNIKFEDSQNLKQAIENITVLSTARIELKKLGTTSENLEIGLF